MPLYEYRCLKCQEITEVIQGFDDPPPARCARCGARKLEKVISRSGFVLKGSGWYQSDYKSSGKKSSQGGESSGSADAPADKPAKPAKKGD